MPHFFGTPTEACSWALLSKFKKDGLSNICGYGVYPEFIKFIGVLEIDKSSLKRMCRKTSFHPKKKLNSSKGASFCIYWTWTTQYYRMRDRSHRVLCIIWKIIPCKCGLSILHKLHLQERGFSLVSSHHKDPLWSQQPATGHASKFSRQYHTIWDYLQTHEGSYLRQRWQHSQLPFQVLCSLQLQKDCCVSLCWYRRDGTAFRRDVHLSWCW